MKKYYSVSIPNPCHEDWNAMTPKEKGRFCGSCSKTVIDFTKMDTYEIQDFINENMGNNVCGHFKQTQLDSINLHIPSQVLEQQKNFHKIFLLALLIAMGTSLMNCTNKNGNTQKIDSVEVIDSINKSTIDTTKVISTKKDSIKINTCKSSTVPVNDSVPLPSPPPLIVPPPVMMTGDVVAIEEPTTGLPVYEEVEEEMIEDDDDVVFGLMLVDTPPEFESTPVRFNREDKRKYFSKKVTDIVTKNFNASVTDLVGKQRILTQFKIDKNGNVDDIKVRTPHPELEKEAIRVIKLLPQFTPATQRGKPVSFNYTLPIVFQVEE